MNHEPQTWVDLQDTGNAQSQLLLQAVARHADWDTGRCFPAAKTLARMAKCSEKTVRRHLEKLQQDGFVEISERHRDDGSQASNLFVLVGYADWIAAARDGGLIARPKRAPRYRDDALGSDEDTRSLAGSKANKSRVDNLTTPSDSLTRAPGQQVTTPNEHFIEQEDSPYPQGGKEDDYDSEDQQSTSPQSRRLIAALTDWGKCDPAVRHLLIPILAARRFSAADALGDLQKLATKANDLPGPLLAKAADLVLAGPKTVKTARVSEAIAAVRKGGLMVPLRKHEKRDQWEAWRAHFARTDPPVARLMGRSVTWQVPAEWPPGFDRAAIHADAAAAPGRTDDRSAGLPSPPAPRAAVERAS